MFWKMYRAYIKNEINRMRQVSIHQFKIAYFKGEFSKRINVCFHFCILIQYLDHVNTRIQKELSELE